MERSIRILRQEQIIGTSRKCIVVTDQEKLLARYGEVTWMHCCVQDAQECQQAVDRTAEQ